MRTAISTTTPAATRSPRHMPKGNQMAQALSGVRPSALSLLEAKPPQYGQSHARGLGEVSRQDRHQLDGALSYRRIGRGAHHGAEEWAVIACKAYNTWLYERFLNQEPAAQRRGVDSVSERRRRRLRSCAAPSKNWACSAACCRRTAKRSRDTSAIRSTGRSMKKRKNSAAPGRARRLSPSHGA